MRDRTVLWFCALAMLLANTLCAQDLAGGWQGTLKAGQQELRIVVQIARGNGGWQGTMYSIDQSTNPMPITAVTVEGSTVKFAIEAVGGAYEGKLGADGGSIDGAWTQGRPLPLRLERAKNESAWKIDTGTHTVQMIPVDKDVKLEVLDWGGSGRPLVLLAGLGDNAHVFDKFAQKLIGSYHVYGITRRGFGESSKPATGYGADRLGDDVLAVIAALKLNKPLLAGHSIAGEELSSVGSRHPEMVSGLTYLDAGYSYAYYDKTRGDMNIDLAELEKKLEQLRPGTTRDPRALVKELLDTGLPGFERDLREMQKDLKGTPETAFGGPDPPRPPLAARAIMGGEQKYTNIPVPILAIYALPHDLGPNASSEEQARDEEFTGAQAKAFENGVPTARVVRLPHASHYVFRSNEADVLREMNAFIGSLPQ